MSVLPDLGLHMRATYRAAAAQQVVVSGTRSANRACRVWTKRTLSSFLD
jgi:hypothetical protein